MKRKNDRLYNIIFPIWLLWLVPVTWIVVIPANFLIDLAVVFITMKCIKVQNIKQNIKSSILRVWLFGFLADFIGTACMMVSNLIDFDFQTEFGKWWYYNIESPVSYSPFESIYSILWITACVIITGIFIYIFNYKICLRNTDLDKTQKKKIALSLAIFTAPYLFYLPTKWFYR